METVTNIASAASRAIWGEGTNADEKKDLSGKEPVAGELGDVKSGEPYDKGNVDTDDANSLPAKSTLTSNTEPVTTESTSHPSSAAVLLPESSSTSRDTPTNLLTTSDKPSTASEKAAKLPSETTESEALTFSKSDPKDTKVGATGTESLSATGPESLEEKASAVKGTTGFDTSSPGSASTTGPTATKSDGLRQETVGSTGLLEEKRVKPESASEPKIGETSTGTPKKSSDIKSSEPKKSLDGGEGGEKEKKSLKEKIKEKLHRHKD